jgi:hypothetical protein
MAFIEVILVLEYVTSQVRDIPRGDKYKAA